MLHIPLYTEALSQLPLGTIKIKTYIYGLQLPTCFCFDQISYTPHWLSVGLSTNKYNSKAAILTERQPPQHNVALCYATLKQ